jgi:excisionase family DNA binding protein
MRRIPLAHQNLLMEKEALVSPHPASDNPTRFVPEPGPEYLSRGEVARLFGVSLSTVTRWARTGRIATVRTPGGHYRYRAENMRQIARSGAGIQGAD